MLQDSDAAAGFEVTENFRRFSQMDDMFPRAFWDPRVRSDDRHAFISSYRMQADPKLAKGFGARDLALRNAFG